VSSITTDVLLQITNNKLSFTGQDFWNVLPLLIVLVTAVLLVIFDMFLPRAARAYLGWLAIIGYAGAIAASLSVFNTDNRGIAPTSFFGFVVRDNFTSFFEILFCITGILCVLISPSYVLKRGIPIGETYSIQAFSVLGMMVVAASGDLIGIFVGIELVSIASYMLTAFARDDRGSAEGALKYFLLGIFATAILVYGMTWLFGMTGSTNIARINQALAQNPGLTTDAGLIRLQNRCRAVPRLDAGRLRRCADADYRLYVGGSQSGRVRGVAPRDGAGYSANGCPMVGGYRRPRRPDYDVG
jgi:NADH:ubiquinone oxidoreductase subunit 2 (subunit N)